MQLSDILYWSYMVPCWRDYNRKLSLLWGEAQYGPLTQHGGSGYRDAPSGQGQSLNEKDHRKADPVCPLAS